jgi:acyl-CoA reductase-like NAD-dependent aldehyde dehydrogenase
MKFYKFEKLYIGGQWTEATESRFLEVENPATGHIIGRVPRGGEEDVDAAVRAAKNAFSLWSQMTLEQRVEKMKRVYAYLTDREAQLIEIEIAELGAPLKWTKRAQVGGPLARFKDYIERIQTFEFEEDLPQARIVKEPVGVVGCLTPWNYPINQVIQKIVPAILAGNTVVLKPSQMTPISAFVLAEAFEAAEVPGGVFNLVSGRGAEVGNALAKHEWVDMISFTGSTEGGKQVGRLALGTVKKLALELGGKSANILLEGADYDLALSEGLKSCFYNTGQTCSAWTRMLVPKQDLKTIEEKLVKMAAEFKVGDPTLEETDIGPLASQKQFDKVRGYIQEGVESGARLIYGEVPEKKSDGYFVKPCIFSDVDNRMTIAQEEIFGPVLCVIPYESVEDAVRLANDSMYGLSGAVFGPEEEAVRVARAIRTGNVYVNDGKRDIGAPFGGYKQSGIGREGGTYGIEEYLEVKAIYK